MQEALTSPGIFVRPDQVSATPERGSLLCPACYEPVHARRGEVNRWHFAHYADTDCPAGQGESEEHILLKRAVARLYEALGYRAQLEVWSPNRTRRTDVLLTPLNNSSERPICVEVQRSSLQHREMVARAQGHKAWGCRSMWIFGLTQGQSLPYSIKQVANDCEGYVPVYDQQRGKFGLYSVAGEKLVDWCPDTFEHFPSGNATFTRPKAPELELKKERQAHEKELKRAAEEREARAKEIAANKLRTLREELKRLRGTDPRPGDFRADKATVEQLEFRLRQRDKTAKEKAKLVEYYDQRLKREKDLTQDLRRELDELRGIRCGNGADLRSRIKDVE